MVNDLEKIEFYKKIAELAIDYNYFVSGIEVDESDPDTVSIFFTRTEMEE